MMFEQEQAPDLRRQAIRPVYLDVCALSRPFDDQGQMRIRLETDAVQLILSHVRAGGLRLVVSPVHEYEIRASADLAERDHLLALLSQVGAHSLVDLREARERAEQLVRLGVGPADAAHLAFAEKAGAAFVTCDDRLLRRCRRLQLEVWAGTPVAFCDEENLR